MKNRRYRRHYAMLILEAITALAILAGTGIPLSLSVQLEQRKIRSSWHRAAVMELIDGELELLHAGLYRQVGEGVPTPYHPHADIADRLPPGAFTVTVSAAGITLEWQSADQRYHLADTVPIASAEALP